MGPIVDRTKEYLGAGDGAVLAVRRCLNTAVRQFMNGETPQFAQHASIDYHTTAPQSMVVAPDEDWRAML
jgi:hypothetical protein